MKPEACNIFQNVHLISGPDVFQVVEGKSDAPNVPENSFQCSEPLNQCHEMQTVQQPVELSGYRKGFISERVCMEENCNKSIAIVKNTTQIGKKASHKNSYLSKYQQNHIREKPYESTEYEKTLIYKSDLLVNQRTYTGNKGYVCKPFGKSCSCKSCLTIHQRTHIRGNTMCAMNLTSLVIIEMT